MTRSLVLSFACLLVACAPPQPTPETSAQPGHAGNRDVAPALLGPNPVALSVHRPLRAWIDSSVFATRGVLMRQDLSRQRSTIVAYTARNDRLTTVPRIELRRALQVEVEGIDVPVTLCAPPGEDDATPCIPASAVTVDSRVAHVGDDGTIQFAEYLTADETASLGDSVQRLHLPILVGGQQLADLDLPLRFETPNDLVLRGAAGTGPDLQVEVAQLSTGRVGYTIRMTSGGTRTYRAVVERAAADKFHVISRGSDGDNGANGSSGRDGLSGSMGASAICPSFAGGDGGRGEDGQPGGDGQAGGDGGRGGNVVAEVKHAIDDDALIAVVRRTVSSEGGSGGNGGFGGTGGRGGSGGLGGSGTTCTDANGSVSMLSGGSTGFAGIDGRSGFVGRSGFGGAAGRVTIKAIE